MRNILQYPVTYEEAIRFMDEWLSDYELAHTGPIENMPIGDMRPLVARWIKERLTEQQATQDDGK